MSVYRFIFFVMCLFTVLAVIGHFATRANRRADLVISYEGGVPAGIVVKIKEADGGGIFLVYTSKMLIYAVPASRLEGLKKPVLGYRVTEVPRGNGEIDLFFEGQEVLVPAYVWHE